MGPADHVTNPSGSSKPCNCRHFWAPHDECPEPTVGHFVFFVFPEYHSRAAAAGVPGAWAASVLAEGAPGVRQESGFVQGGGEAARGRAGLRAACRLSAAALRSKPAGLSQRLGPARKRLAGLSRQSGPRGYPDGCATWPLENAPVLAEAATAPRKTDMRAHAIGRGGGGGARSKQEGEDGGNVRGGRRARARARRNIRRRDSQGASQITRTTVRALSRLVERILMWGPSVGVFF